MVWRLLLCLCVLLCKPYNIAHARSQNQHTHPPQHCKNASSGVENIAALPHTRQRDFAAVIRGWAYQICRMISLLLLDLRGKLGISMAKPELAITWWRNCSGSFLDTMPKGTLDLTIHYMLSLMPRWLRLGLKFQLCESQPCEARSCVAIRLEASCQQAAVSFWHLSLAFAFCPLRIGHMRQCRLPGLA